MIKDGVIIDTSVLIDFLKNTEPNAAAVEKLILEQRILTTGVIVAELLQGIRYSKEELYVTELIDSIPAVELTNDIWIDAGRLACTLRRKGITLPLTDLAIAALSIKNNLSVFTIDNHFKHIPGVSIYKI